MPSVNSIDPIVASASSSVSVSLESLAEWVEDLAKQVKLLQTRSNSGALSNSFRRRFSGSPHRNLASQSESTPYDHILQEYPTLTRPAGPLRNVSHSTVHHIGTPGAPVLPY
ncbi:hypothetical protein TNCV_3826851 [Trichonephila clavipes]|nr:hypothetical protein TNCV_3826851 [Trichonephila clavipes]